MKRKALTTAALLTAAMAMPTLAEDAPPAEAVPPASRVQVIQSADGDGQVNTRVVVTDKDGNVTELEGIEAQAWVEGNNNRIAPGNLGVQGVEMVQDEDGEIRVFLRQLGEPDVVPQAPVDPPMVEATYLGLNCEPLDFDTAALLLVTEGTGLNVTFVAPDSPAASAGLEPGDTLLKMGDQILINPEQLAMLIRTQDAGEEVTLRVIREGEEFDLTAELGTNTVPQLGPGGRNLNQFWNVERQGNAAQPGQIRFFPEELQGGEMAEQLLRHQVQIERMLRNMERQPLQFNQQQNFRFQNNNGAMQMTWSDGEHTLQIGGDGEGNQTLNVKDADGNELFDGPMPEGDAIDELPEGVGEKVREMTQGQQFQFNIEIEEAPVAPEEVEVEVETEEVPAQAPAADQ